jgi:DNA-binding NarL/FixJ family response regulator
MSGAISRRRPRVGESHILALHRHPDEVWVHISTTQCVVETGLETMMKTGSAPFRIRTTGPPDSDPDVVLFDVILMREGDTKQLQTWLNDSAATVIAIDRTLRPELGVAARAAGVEWAIDLGITREDLLQVIEEAVAGHLEDSDVANEWQATAYPGQQEGLSRRESDVLHSVVQGRSNQDIAEDLFLSINSVKTYIRSAYRKIQARSRSQAVIWAIQHGFTPAPGNFTPGLGEQTRTPQEHVDLRTATSA